MDVVEHNKKLIYIKRDDLLSPYYPGNKVGLRHLLLYHLHCVLTAAVPQAALVH